MTRASRLPVTGASTGTIEVTAPSTANARVVPAPGKRSTTIARPTTMHAAVAKPARTRTASSIRIEAESALSTCSSAYADAPISSGARRPTASLSGPITTCPTAMPTRTHETVAEAAALLVCRSALTRGSTGR